MVNSQSVNPVQPGKSHMRLVFPTVILLIPFTAKNYKFVETIWFLEGAGFRIPVRVCSVLSMKNKILMLMKNYGNWKTTKQLSTPAKNPSVLTLL